MMNAHEEGLRCKNFAVEFRVGARRAGPRHAFSALNVVS
jgi:hypothetical protein